MFDKIMSRWLQALPRFVSSDWPQVELVKGEGLMLRRAGSSYSAGRTNDLLKVRDCIGAAC